MEVHHSKRRVLANDTLKRSNRGRESATAHHPRGCVVDARDLLLLKPIDQALLAGSSDTRDSGKVSGETEPIVVGVGLRGGRLDWTR